MSWPTRLENQATPILFEESTSTHTITLFSDGIIAISAEGTDEDLPEFFKNTKDRAGYVAIPDAEIEIVERAIAVRKLQHAS